MKKNCFLIVLILLISASTFAQGQTNPPTDFWKKVQFGGGIGMSFGSGYTDIFLAPSAIYVVNPTFAVGTSLHLGYASQSHYYTSFVYGASIIGLVNPIPQIQLSVELEELNSSTNYKVYGGGNFSDNYWDTGLYLGAGYRTGNVTIGARYDVLYDANKSIYGDPFMPFVRVYF